MKKIFSVMILYFSISLMVSCAEKKDLNSTSSQTVTEDVNASVAKITFIELGSVKCVPCKMMMPIIEEIKKEYADKVRVVFYDVWTDEGKPFATTYKIRAIPTQIFLDKNGKEYYRHEGFFPKEELVKILEKGLKND